MVLLLFLHDGTDGDDRGVIDTGQVPKLVLQVTENHPFHRDRRRGNGATTKERGDDAKRVAADATQQVAAATPDTPALKLGLEYGPVLFLVRLELGEFVEETSTRDLSHEALARIDIHRAMLARMVHLESSLSKTVRWARQRDQFHAVNRFRSWLGI